MPTIAITVNGARHELEVEPRVLLVDFIREELGLTGTHVGLRHLAMRRVHDPLDGRAVKSCTVLAVQADGTAIETIEALAEATAACTPSSRRSGREHGLQRGFCTPGMIMATTELIADDPPERGGNPAWPGRQPLPLHGLREHRQGRRGRGGEVSGMTTQLHAARLIGAPIKRVEDPRLITGAAKYIDDLKLPGVAHVAILRSPHAHARIAGIDVSRAAASPGVVGVFTGKDFEHLNPLPCAMMRKRLRRSQVLAFFAGIPPCLAIGLEVLRDGAPLGA